MYFTVLMVKFKNTTKGEELGVGMMNTDDKTQMLNCYTAYGVLTKRAGLTAAGRQKYIKYGIVHLEHRLSI